MLVCTPAFVTKLTQGAPGFGAVDLPAESAVKPEIVVRTNDYTEGVVVDHDGNLYFSHEKIVTKVDARRPGRRPGRKPALPTGTRYSRTARI